MGIRPPTRHLRHGPESPENASASPPWPSLPPRALILPASRTNGRGPAPPFQPSPSGRSPHQIVNFTPSNHSSSDVPLGPMSSWYWTPTVALQPAGVGPVGSVRFHCVVTPSMVRLP